MSRLERFIETLGMDPEFWAAPWKPSKPGDEPPF